MPDSRVSGFKKEIDTVFVPADFQAMWFMLNDKYQMLGFNDEISDELRIEEYKYIVQQFRRYISNMRERVIVECDTLEKMLGVVDSQLSNTPEYGSDRKTIAYNFIRDDWLYGLRAIVYDAIVNVEEEEE